MPSQDFFTKNGWISEAAGEFLKRAMPLAVMFITTFATWALSLAQNAGVKNSWKCPPLACPASHIPQFTTQMISDLLPTAVFDFHCWLSRKRLSSQIVSLQTPSKS